MGVQQACHHMLEPDGITSRFWILPSYPEKAFVSSRRVALAENYETIHLQREACKNCIAQTQPKRASRPCTRKSVKDNQLPSKRRRPTLSHRPSSHIQRSHALHSAQPPVHALNQQERAQTPSNRSCRASATHKPGAFPRAGGRAVPTSLLSPSQRTHAHDATRPVEGPTPRGRPARTTSSAR